MSLAMLRISSRLTYMGLAERNSSLAVILKKHHQKFYSNYMGFIETHSMTVATNSPLRSFSKKIVGQTRDYSNKHAETSPEHENERDPHARRGETDFWRRKISHLHGLFDTNKDGVISFDDYIILADKFGNMGNLNPDEIEEFKSIMKSTWEAQWGEITPYNLVTVEQYLKDMNHVVNDKELQKKCHNFLPFIFKAIDHDRSGEICIKEFKLFFKCLGLSEENAIATFAVIDENGDGKLSMEEFIKLGRDFIIKDDETCPSKMFWGPLTER